MRLWSVFRKTLQELSRDWLLLLLTLVFAPAFVYLYYLFFPGGSTAYTILVINRDVGSRVASGDIPDAGKGAIEAISRVAYANGNPLLRVKAVEDRAVAEAFLRNRDATAFILIPQGFSAAIQDARHGVGVEPTSITFGGDLSNPYYVVGALLATSAVDAYIQEASGIKPFVQYVEEPLGASAARTEFETYVPGIFVFAVILMVFLAAMTVAHEVETGTIRRLQITKMSSFEFLGGVSAALALVGMLSVVLTFLTALALGYRSQGPLWVAVLVGGVTSLSIIGVGMIIACFSRTVSQAFVIANFPLGLFMFFTGAAFPVPRPTIFMIAGRSISPYDILPPTHAVVALNKILNLGAGLDEVTFELVALAILSLVYFWIGAWLFKRMHLKKK